MAVSIFNPSSLIMIMLMCFCFNVMCNGAAITFEQYESLQGERFCSTRGKPFHTGMCVRDAELNSIVNYQKNFMICECTQREIKLYQQDGSRAARRFENLLDCRYDGPIALKEGTSNTYTNSFSEARALGRGIASADVMEYKYEGELAVPYANRVNMLTEVQA